jgi:hypothetical protein
LNSLSQSITHLSQLHDASCRRLCGPVSRSLAYWKSWWLAQCRSERKGPTRGFALLVNARSPTGDDNWLAYILVRDVLQPAQPQGEVVAPSLVLDIVEYACADAQGGGRPAFDALVSSAIAGMLLIVITSQSKPIILILILYDRAALCLSQQMRWRATRL